MTRGDVYEVRLARRRGHAQQGRRYGVIVQSDPLLELSTVIVAPTSTAVSPATFRPEIAIGSTATRVLVEQLRVVDVERLGQFAGHLSPREQQAVDDALRVVLDLS